MSGPFDLRSRFELGSRAAAGDRIREGQYLAASALLRRLYGLDSPGAVLADEVGLGKTYVALGVAAWLLTERPRSRILVLTNSRYMMDVWWRRWSEIELLKGQPRPEAVRAYSFQKYRELAANGSIRFMVSSYETLKRFGLDDWARVRASIGSWLFKPRHRSGTRFGKATARALKRAIGIDLRIRPTKLGRRIPAHEARLFWRKHFDWERRAWIDSYAATAALEDMELRWEATGGYSARAVPFDLVIVDEAHRLDAHRRQEAMRLLLNNRTRKILYVTATPFALDVGQLERLLGLFSLAHGCDSDAHGKNITQLRLREFERAVDAGKEYPQLAELEQRLRRWIVRRSWAEESTVLRRLREEWAFPPDSGTGYAASLALERAIADLLLAGERTHIASRRAGLCSSWRAARRSFEESPLGDETGGAGAWSRLAARLIKDCGHDAPKIHEAVSRIAGYVKSGRKVLVFSERSETLSLVRDLLRADLQHRQVAARQAAERLVARQRRGRWLALAGEQNLSPAQHRAVLRMVAGATPDRPRWEDVDRIARAWWRRSVASLREDLVAAYGGGQSIRAVEIYDGERGDDSTIARFNMPGTPWVLLCSKKAQESIDLHHECNIVVLLDPIWNPAHREQRIGRVHRVGSRFEEVRVIDVYTAQTYDEVIFQRAQKRAEMMAVLLGAGHWLDHEKEVSNLGRYSIDLSPRSRLERGLLPYDEIYLERHWSETAGRICRIVATLGKLPSGAHPTATIHTAMCRKGPDPHLSNVGKDLERVRGVYVVREENDGRAAWRLTRRARRLLGA
jgi:superfamily II DNA or RNA helicase